jgi:hypothetical protein
VFGRKLNLKDPSQSFRKQSRQHKKGGSFPTERRTSCQRPSGILNTLDEHEAHQAPFHGSMGLLTAEPLIEAKTERRKRKQTK